MMKRSVFLTVVAGLLASLALAAPSQAGSVVTTNLVFSGLGTGVDTIVIDYSGAGTISNLVQIAPGFPSASSEAITGPSQVTVTLTPATTQEAVAFKFDSTTSFGNGTPPNITVLSSTGSPGSQNLTTQTQLSFSSLVIPEPTGIALLGIGMTGLLAFRRLFKRTLVA